MNVGLAYNSDIMAVYWQDSAKDVDYEVQVLLGDGLVPLDPQPAARCSINTRNVATIDAKALGQGLTYRARVRAVKVEYHNVFKTEKYGNVFEASYDWDAKAQTINLIAKGFKPDFLDKGPMINISEWLISHPDSQCQYRLVVELRDENQKAIECFATGVINAPNDPERVHPTMEITHMFSNYQSGLRYIYFEHSWRDIKQLGNYGSKLHCNQRIQITIFGDRMVGEWSTASTDIYEDTMSTKPVDSNRRQ